MANIEKRLVALENKPTRHVSKTHLELLAAVQRVEAGLPPRYGLENLVYDIYHGNTSTRIDSVRELDYCSHLPLYQTILRNTNGTH